MKMCICGHYKLGEIGIICEILIKKNIFSFLSFFFSLLCFAGVNYNTVWHHRHWQKVLANAAGCSFSMLPSPLPKEGTILGGTITLKGNNLSLACFHGFNFRSKSWAIFSISEPDIIFATEAQISAEGGRIYISLRLHFLFLYLSCKYLLDLIHSSGYFDKLSTLDRLLMGHE